MEMTDTATTAKARVHRALPGTWMISIQVICCQPLAPLQRWHNYTTTNLRWIGSRKGCVKTIHSKAKMLDG